jgi:hypothetical protein
MQQVAATLWLDMVYTRSEVGKVNEWNKDEHVTQAQMYGDDLQALIVFIPDNARGPYFSG